MEGSGRKHREPLQIIIQVETAIRVEMKKNAIQHIRGILL
jgi:hypothetical protein